MFAFYFKWWILTSRFCIILWILWFVPFLTVHMSLFDKFLWEMNWVDWKEMLWTDRWNLNWFYFAFLDECRPSSNYSMCSQFASQAIDVSRIFMYDCTCVSFKVVLFRCDYKSIQTSFFFFFFQSSVTRIRFIFPSFLKKEKLKQ